MLRIGRPLTRVEIETPDRNLALAAIDDDLHTWFNDQARSLDASLYGRRMYQLMAAY